MYTYMHTCIHTCTYIYIYIYTHIVRSYPSSSSSAPRAAWSPRPSRSLHSAEGGAVETGCSDLYDVIH